MSPSLPERVERFIASRRLLRQGEALLIALSAGPDSTALLAILSELSTAWGWRLHAHHIQHGLRDDQRDLEQARLLSAHFGVPFSCDSLAPGQVASAPGQGLEDKARKLRHQLLAARAEQLGVSTIALGHHGDDVLETLLIRLLRGAGLRGLAGLRAQGPSPAAKDIQLIRPLLQETSQALKDYLSSRGLAAAQDPSNSDLRFLRNRIRHQVLPQLEKTRGSGGLTAARRSALNLSDDAAALDGLCGHFYQQGQQTAEPGWYLAKSVVQDLGAAAAKALFQHAANQLGTSLSQLALEQGWEALIRSQQPWRSDGFEVGVDGAFATIRAMGVELALPQARDFTGEAIEWGGLRLVRSREAQRSSLYANLPLGEIRGALRIEPAAKWRTLSTAHGGKKRIAELLREAGVPARWRKVAPLLCDEAGPLWLPPLRLAARVWRNPGSSEEMMGLKVVALPWYLRQASLFRSGVRPSRA